MASARTAQFTCAFGLGVIATLSSPAAAASRLQINLPEQALSASIQALAIQSGRSIIADGELVERRRVSALTGTFTVEQALVILLKDSGLRVSHEGNSLVVGATSAEDGDIVVTGTRIRGTKPIGANLVTIDRNDIARSGYATTPQILASLPQNFGGGAAETTPGFTQRNNANANIGFGSGINLRGLGNNSTLTLIDGNRAALSGIGGNFVDLSLIPASLIERIEILPDGASAIYGSDAVAGVVNLRLRRDLDGAETQLRYGSADGFHEVQASQLAGFRWSSGHLIAAYEYYRRGRLGTADRRYGSEDLRPFGGPDYRQAFGNPGTIIASIGEPYAIPRGQDGSALVSAALVAGSSNFGDGRAQTDLVPRTARHSAYTAVQQELAPGLVVSAQGFFADRRSSQRTYAFNSPVTVGPETPFYVDPIGTGEPISVQYDFRQDLGAPTNQAHVTNWGGSASLKAALGAWSGELNGSYSYERDRLREINLVNYARLANALSDPDPATAFNLFGDGSFTDRSTIDRVRGSYLETGRSRLWAGTLKFEGPLFQLPAGPVRMAVGGEYRRQSYADHAFDDEFSETPEDLGTSGFPLSRGIAAGYAELLAQIVNADMQLPGIRSLDLSLAGRVERYSDFGVTGNPRFGLNWVPLSGITVRASYGTSFRAPSFTDIRQSKGFNQILPLPLADSNSPTGSTNVLAIVGNRPDIGPENAHIWSAGIDVVPKLLRGLRASLTYFSIDYRDRISNPAGNLFSLLLQRSQYETLFTSNPSAASVAALYADPTFNNPYAIPASDVQLIVDARNANLARSVERGLDFDIGFRRGSSDRFIEVGASGTWLFRLTQQITKSAPAVDVLGAIGNPVDLRVRGRALAGWGAANIAAFVNYTNGYRNDGVSPEEHVGSWTTVDFQLGIAPSQIPGLKLSLSINNVFDEQPPYVSNRTPYSAIGYDPDQASAVGRLIAMQLSKSW